VTDDLLNEATRLADEFDEGADFDAGRVLRALVERVQQAEADARKARQLVADKGFVAVKAEVERDWARGKLDRVRRLIPTENPELIEAGYGVDSADVLAILDGKE
jgi:hypothetical protein